MLSASTVQCSLSYCRNVLRTAVSTHRAQCSGRGLYGEGLLDAELLSRDDKNIASFFFLFQFCLPKLDHITAYQNTCKATVTLIRIWPIFYTGVHCRHRQKKTNALHKWKRCQWCRAALTCTDMFRRLTLETKSFWFFPSVYASVSCSFVLNTSLPCLHL